MITIRVEGGVGVGKSVIVEGLEEFFKSKGFTVTSDRTQLDESFDITEDLRLLSAKQPISIVEHVVSRTRNDE